ncbi:sigma-54-dependent Fis family transcriptional regulator [Acinetobacter baumannii]|uniref:sigma-54-dependent Fis family transcriptional regulator n=1 Tax=Acinetobacter baumannii TaxID=470 RepID=UPI00112BEAB9|nr:sigma 54-interacting transcriptional regulator [Acinetobacter baumannii]TPT53251.1 sigma-54-dependent Fis family transcriptional regulator [Acinetobacter baumannii]
MDDLSKISWKNIKYNFYHSGELPDVVQRDSPILQAWESAKKAGLSPFSQLTTLYEFQIDPLSGEDMKFAALAEGVLNDIWQLFGQQDVCVFLINHQLKIIAERHNPNLDRQYHFLRTGRVIDPSIFGAIAPTCSVLSKQPMIMMGHQHYLDEFANYSCASVPIFNGAGVVLGALDITSPKGLLASNWLRHLLYQSYILENKIIHTALRSEQRILYFQHSKDLLENAYTGMIVLDEHGKIIKANQMALKLLNCAIDQLLDRTIHDFFFTEILNQLDSSDSFLIQSYDHAFFYAKLSQLNINALKNPKQIANLILDQALKALKADIPVLITGETGTGKDHFAQQLHQQLDPKLPFISINCGAIPDHLLESELFGYEGGAFTGAKKQGEKGLIELADQGILFLDEIGDLALHLQVKILRVLQNQQFYRVGGREPMKSTFKLLCATHQDLTSKIEQQLFRRDLYYRICGFQVHLEPLRLRQNKQEIFHQILDQFGVLQWSAKVEQQFNAYTWPGNIRELIHIVRLSAAFNDEKVLNQLYLPDCPFNIQNKNQSMLSLENNNLNAMTKHMVMQVLDEENGNIARTAKRLNISRTTVYKYISS